MSSPESDIADGIVPKKPEHIAPTRAEFLPWHKLRKHYIRCFQWNKFTKWNVVGKWRDELQKTSAGPSEPNSTLFVSQPLRCLVIPGNHLLDLRSLWTEIGPLDCYLRYLGFNDDQGSDEMGTDVFVSNNAVTSLPGVLRDSQVLKDRFEAIARTNSPAYKYLKQYGPYHVVNLDFCGSMFPNTSQEVEPYYAALIRLLEYQFAAQKIGWLLFITTRVEPSVTDNEWMQRLCKPTRENFDAHPLFATKVESLFPRSAMDANGASANIAGLSNEQMISLFGVALGKWLIRLAQSSSPKWTVNMRDSFRYTVNEHEGSVLLSLAFEITPNFSPPVDTTGMSKLEVIPKTFPSEAESAIKLADSVAQIADVDGKLAKDANTRAAMRDEAANLLASAGFDREKYIQWVDAGEPTTPG